MILLKPISMYFQAMALIARPVDFSNVWLDGWCNGRSSCIIVSSCPIVIYCLICKFTVKYVPEYHFRNCNNFIKTVTM